MRLGAPAGLSQPIVPIAQTIVSAILTRQCDKYWLVDLLTNTKAKEVGEMAGRNVIAEIRALKTELNHIR